MLQINEKFLVKNGQIILPLDYIPSKEEEKIFEEKNITVKYTDNNGELYRKEGDNFIKINTLDSSKKNTDTSTETDLNTPKVRPYTSLNSKIKVFKGDIQIRFRGELDNCIAHSLFLQTLSKNEKVHIWLNAIRSILGNIMGATVVEDYRLEAFEIDGLHEDLIHKYSHKPLKYIGYGHIVPAFEHGEECIRINTLRTKIRMLENTAFNIYTSDKGGENVVTRPDILKTLNRLSSACYVLMIMIVHEQGEVEHSEIKRYSSRVKKAILEN